MIEIFYAVYYIQLTDKEIEKVENEDLIDDENFEDFCFQSKNKKLIALFADKFNAESFSESITDNSGIIRASAPMCIIRKIKIEIDE